MLRWYTSTNTFLLGEAIAVTLCFIRRKRPAQLADQISQVFGKVLVAHLVEVIASLFVWHNYEAKHLFTCQGSHALWLLRCTPIFSVDVGELPATCRQKPFPKCFVVEDEGDGSPLDLLCHVQALLIC